MSACSFCKGKPTEKRSIFSIPRIQVSQYEDLFKNLGLPFNSNKAKICEIHFEEDQIKRKKYSVDDHDVVTFIDQRPALRSRAFPTLHLPSRMASPQPISKRRINEISSETNNVIVIQQSSKRQKLDDSTATSSTIASGMSSNAISQIDTDANVCSTAKEQVDTEKTENGSLKSLDNESKSVITENSTMSSLQSLTCQKGDNLTISTSGYESVTSTTAPSSNGSECNISGNTTVRLDSLIDIEMTLGNMPSEPFEKPKTIPCKQMTFTEIFDNISEVKLPSTLWCFCSDPNKKWFMFAQLNVNGTGLMKTGLKVTQKVHTECEYYLDSNTCKSMEFVLNTDILTKVLNDLDSGRMFSPMEYIKQGLEG